LIKVFRRPGTPLPRRGRAGGGPARPPGDPPGRHARV